MQRRNGRRRRRRRRHWSDDNIETLAKSRKTLTEVGKLVTLCLVIACGGAGGLWNHIQVPADLVDARWKYDHNSIVGVVLTRWIYVSHTYLSDCATACEQCKWLLDAETKRCRTQNHIVFLLYDVEGFARLAHAILCPANANSPELKDLVHKSLTHALDVGSSAWSEPITLYAIVSSWQASVDATLKLTTMRFNPLYIQVLLSNIGFMPFHITSLGTRVLKKHLVSGNDPSAHVLNALGQIATASNQALHRGSRGWEHMLSVWCLALWVHLWWCFGAWWHH